MRRHGVAHERRHSDFAFLRLPTRFEYHFVFLYRGDDAVFIQLLGINGRWILRQQDEIRKFSHLN